MTAARMNLLTLWLKQYRLRQVKEHLFVLHDQKVSAEVGIRRYEARAQRLEEQIAALESPRTILGRIA